MRLAALLAALCASAEAETAWTLARGAHFEIYSQAGSDAARAALRRFEQLRRFSEQAGFDLSNRPPVRIIAFRSAAEYNPYRSGPTADAYYAGSETSDFIVLPDLNPAHFNLAAHEYAHLCLHANGLPANGVRLPSWLNEGLAEFLSSARISSHGSTIGGELPPRIQALRRRWIPLAELLAIASDSPLRLDREQDALFYAQSWALTHMLALAPGYSSGLPKLIAAIQAGTPSRQALESVYDKPLAAIERDVHAWVERGRFTPISLPGIPRETTSIQISTAPDETVRLMLAGVMLATGDMDRAERLYRDTPAGAARSAGFGAVAMRRGDRELARREWRQAIAQGIDDPLLCYNYAKLAQQVGAGNDDVRPALERAVALQPGFDDARYALALLEMNSGHYEQAVLQLRAMKTIAPVRTHDYWMALANSLNELDRREEAKSAAALAAKAARTPGERAHAAELAYFADTDFAVRFTRDANGRAQLVAARSPHGATDWNPFIEPRDRIHRVAATLREIQCGGPDSRSDTRIEVTTSNGALVLAIPDLSRVRMRNAPAEFTCGPQEPRAVRVEYAEPQSGGAYGLVRGMDFNVTGPAAP